MISGLNYEAARHCLNNEAAEQAVATWGVRELWVCFHCLNNEAAEQAVATER